MQPTLPVFKGFWRRAALACVASTAICSVAFAPFAQACTSFLLRTSDGGAVYGRTMEFGFLIDSQAIVVPRRFALRGSGPDGKPGLAWNAKYGAVGLNAYGLPVFTDGMNEKGLAGGILLFPGYAGYADPAMADAGKSLAPWEFLTWALTSFATVQEVKAALSGITIINLPQSNLGATPPVHYALHDASGASIVIEPVAGVLKVYDNPTGVLTNAPTFDWQITNLRNYVKISPENAPPLKLDGMTIAPLGEGSGLLGVPGDPTPPSRFVRALAYVVTAKKMPTGDESVRLAEHILNNFDIPSGFIQSGRSVSTKTPLEFTQWSSIADLSRKRYYVKTYEDQVLRGIDLMNMDLDAKTIQTAVLKPDMPVPMLEFSKP
ncbi:linear amide C-N hydrolase [Methyloferula stellata]|uniref:linear amide C-N hydrolase n=1 Tax=Methyloferula stellata TaxID=876270 RepID=UPI00035EF7F6|nr:choloylglycine hydrolase family protein [Methyloferula stellata]